MNFLLKTKAMGELIREKVEPIINGRVNPRLTLGLFSELEYEQKASVVWNLVVNSGYAHNYADVDRDVFEPLETGVDYKSITPENVDELYVEIKNKFDAHYKKLLVKTNELHDKQGREIYDAQKKLGFGGFLELSVGKLKGYLKERGGFNCQNPITVCRALNVVHKNAPRKDYGVNNPNTGIVNHNFKTTGDYVVMEFRYVDVQEVEKIREFYGKYWEKEGKDAKADSIRIHVEEYGYNHYIVELIWWWD